MATPRRALDDLLPIRRILVDGVEQRFTRDLDFDSETCTISTDGHGVTSIGIGAKRSMVVVGATRETKETGPVVFGARYFGSSSGTPMFRAVLQATTGMTARARLLDASGNVLGTLTSTSVAVPQMREVAVTIASTQVYIVDVCISAGLPGDDDRAICHSACVDFD